MNELIIRPAVEEEARIMLLVIQIAKEESIDSTKIMQGHNWVVDFLQYILGKIEN
jgi:predicted transcriptional regulator